MNAVKLLGDNVIKAGPHIPQICVDKASSKTGNIEQVFLKVSVSCNSTWLDMNSRDPISEPQPNFELSYENRVSCDWKLFLHW